MVYTDPEMADLPDDDELAFAVFEERLRGRTRKAEGDDEGIDLARFYSNHLLAFIDVADLDIPVDRDVPLPDTQFWPWYQRFLQVIDYHTVKYRLSHARGLKAGEASTVTLTDDYRTQISKLLERIRKVIHQTDLSDERKDDIYKMLAALQFEVDRSSTPFAKFLARYLDVANALGKSAEKLEPAVKLLERVMKVLGNAKADSDVGTLPSPEETKSLPSPNGGESTSSDSEDEIPI